MTASAISVREWTVMGMSDLISRDAILEELYEMDISRCKEHDDVIHLAYAKIAHAPQVEAVSVVHARWIAEYRTICSACKTRFDDDMFWIQGDFTKPNYCPNCGARMDGDADV